MDINTGINPLNKAIELVSKAVELDAAGEFREAFKYYNQSLQYFLPVMISKSFDFYSTKLIDLITIQTTSELKYNI